MDYPSNSRKEREQEDSTREDKKVDKVVTGGVTRRKQPLGKRLTETFVGGDAKSVWGYVLFDVLVPAAKDMVADAGSQAIERFLFGETRAGSRRPGARRGGSPNGYVSYNNFSRRDADRADPRNRDFSRRARSSHDFDEILLETRVEANEVIDKMFDLVSQYDQVTVADLYDLVGISASFQDQKWGWTDIRGAGATKVRGGYLLDLPRPEPL
jgi:hypothetical protein